jgi:hypothetical protein
LSREAAEVVVVQRLEKLGLGKQGVNIYNIFPLQNYHPYSNYMIHVFKILNIDNLVDITNDP